MAGFKRAGLDESSILEARRNPGSLTGFLELHIEQGPRLLSAPADIGIVTTLVGIGSLRLSFIGRADHAGTTPMDGRLDSGQGAGSFLLNARKTVMTEFSGCVVNVGSIRFYPGAMNIVPAIAELDVEYRASTADQMKALGGRLLVEAQNIATDLGLGFDYEDLGVIWPTDCDPGMQAAFRKACEVLGLRAIFLESGAGHDTMSMAAVCPSGLIFIPSTGGSHSPREHAEWKDCVNGANVMLQAVFSILNPD